MYKLAILGHPGSNYESIEKYLHQAGMKYPIPLTKNSWGAADITGVICKANQLKIVNSRHGYVRMPSMPVPSVWNGLAMELMINNLEQDIWGWADPNTIYALDYWSEVDKNIIFVFVFNSPESMLLKSLDENICEKKVERLIDDWITYNSRLLDFAKKEPSRCIFVNSDSLIDISNDFVKRLNSLIKSRGGEGEVLYLQKGFVKEDDSRLHSEIYKNLMTKHRVTSGELDMLILSGEPERLISKHLVSKYKKCEPVFHELSLHCLYRTKRKKQKNNVKDSTFELNVLFQRKEIVKRIIVDMLEENNSLRTRFYSLQNENNEHQVKQRELEQQLESLKEQNLLIQNENNERQVKQRELEQQLESFKKQISFITGELNNYIEDNLKLQKNQIPELYGAAERIKQTLGYRLGSIMVNESKKITGVFKVPFLIFKEIRSSKKENIPEQLYPISFYKDAYKAERVKRHLSYQLGMLIDKRRGFFDLFLLPFYIAKTVYLFRKNRV